MSLSSHVRCSTPFSAAIATALEQPQTPDPRILTAEETVKDCRRRLDRYRAALEAGADPALVAGWIAEIQAARSAAEATLRHLMAAPPQITAEDIRAAVEDAGGLLPLLHASDPTLRARFYEEIGLDGMYDPHTRVVNASADLGVRMVRVGGGTRAPGPRLLKPGTRRIDVGEAELILAAASAPTTQVNDLV